MTLISALSAATIVVSIAAVLPQIITMVSNGSAAGQAPLAWILAITTNSTMVYVNAIGLHAILLAAGNVISGLLCAAALGCVLKLRERTRAMSPIDAPQVHQMPPDEFWAVRDIVLVEARRRGTPHAAAE